MRDNIKNADTRAEWGRAVDKLLPGDHIHYTAPLNRPTIGLSPGGLDAIEAAQLKRLRKQQKAAA